MNSLVYNSDGITDDNSNRFISLQVYNGRGLLVNSTDSLHLENKATLENPPSLPLILFVQVPRCFKTKTFSIISLKAVDNANTDARSHVELRGIVEWGLLMDKCFLNFERECTYTLKWG